MSAAFSVFKMTVQSVPASATQNRSLFRDDRIALSVNSCGKSFHINSKAVSAHVIIQWTEIWLLKYQRD